MKTVKIKVCGTERILCKSLRVEKNLIAEFGDDYAGKLEEGSVADKLNIVIGVVHEMIKAGDVYAKMNGIENPEPVSREDIEDCYDVADLIELEKAIGEAAKESAKQEVVAEIKDAGKNAETTPDA